MAAIVDRKECSGCGLCVDECPAEAIKIDDEGISTIDEDECTECGACVDICPSVAISI